MGARVASVRNKGQAQGSAYRRWIEDEATQGDRLTSEGNVLVIDRAGVKLWQVF